MAPWATSLAVTLALAGGQLGPEDERNVVLTVNPGAEVGDTRGWTGAGWAVAGYGSIGATRWRWPSAQDSDDDNTEAFVATTPGATLTQVVPLDRFATEIDAGTQDFWLKADVGGLGDAAGAYVEAQAVDAQDNPTSPPVQLGPPTAADRAGRNTPLRCETGLLTPPTTRAVALTVRSTAGTEGTDVAFADEVIVVFRPVILSAIFPDEDAEAPRCSRLPPAATPTPTPTPTATAGPVRLHRLRLSRAGVRFDPVGPGRFAVRVIRLGAGVVRSKCLVATSSGRLRWTFRKRLAAGRYRVHVRDLSSGTEVAVLAREWDRADPAPHLT